MKMVITTQIRENYGAHDWDGVGECPQYWKCKGGNMYVVPNITVNQMQRIKEQGIPTLTKLISTRDKSFEEHVILFNFLEDNAPVDESWETPYNLSWEDGRWVARRTTENDAYGCMRQEVLRKMEEYDMCEGGARKNYVSTFHMRNGDIVNGKDLCTYLADGA